ncbi:MAG TPA: hypothetical protein VMV19_18315 [Xanthobacteraceae bacterium]|nr:hypothetical protein [Xanthobacteraceae bacterium]
MSEVTKQVLCGACNIEVEQRTDPNGQVMAVCPRCGNSDTLENAIREATEYFADKLTREALGPLERMPSSNFVKVTVTHSPQRSFRFIVNQ